jgi:hypothetical protein
MEIDQSPPFSAEGMDGALLLLPLHALMAQSEKTFITDLIIVLLEY